MTKITKQFIAVIALYHSNKTLNAIIAWGLRLLIFVYLLSLIAPPSARAIMEAPQTVNTTSPKLCIHTRLVDEVYEWKIQRSLQLIREMGATSIVEFFPWAYFEPQQAGIYDWKRADTIVRHAQNQGLSIIARLGFVPAWARPNSTEFSSLNDLPEESFDEFADWVGEFVTRYADTVESIIIWNEPNLAFEWGFKHTDPLIYTRLLKAVYPIAKQANPHIIVMAGALAPTLEAEGSPNGMNDILFLERMYEAGAQSYFDVLAVHTYGFTSPAIEPPAPDTLNFRRVELLREVMIKFGDEATPISITESGWNDHPHWISGVRPSQRVQYTIDSVRLAEQWDWVNHMCIWVFRYPAPTFSYPDNFTLAGTNFDLKPIYFALQDYAQGRTGTTQLWLNPPEER
jgi:polysaccharide biosynthesis protein PslG